MINYRMDIDRPLSFAELDDNFRALESSNLETQTLLADQILEAANLDGKIDQFEQASIARAVQLEVQLATQQEAQIIASAKSDGIVTQFEQAQIEAAADITAAYKEYQNVVLKAMADGVLTDEEEALITLSRSFIDANNARLSNMGTDILAASTEASSASIAAANADGRITDEEAARTAAILAEEQKRIVAITERIESEAALDGKITAAEQATIDAAHQLENDYIEYNRIVTLALADGILTPEEEALIADAEASVNITKGKIADIDNQTKKTKKQVDFVKLAANAFDYTTYSNYGKSPNVLLSSSKAYSDIGKLNYFDQISGTSELKMDPLRATYDVAHPEPIKYVYEKNGLYFIITDNAGTCVVKMFTKSFNDELNKYTLTEEGSFSTTISINTKFTVEFHESYILIFDGTLFEMINYSLNSYVAIDIHQAFIDNADITGADVSSIKMSMFNNYVTFSDFNQSINLNIIDYTYGFTDDTIPFEASTVRKVLFKIDDTTTMYASSNFIALFKDGNFLNAIETKYKYDSVSFNGSIKDFYVYDDLLYISYSEALVIYSTIDLVHFQTLPLESKIYTLFKYQNYLVAIDGNRIFKINTVDDIRSPDVSQYNPYAIDKYQPKTDQSLITKRFMDDNVSTIPKKTFLDLIKTYNTSNDPYFDVRYNEHTLKQQVFFKNKYICDLPYAYFSFETCFVYDNILHIAGTYLHDPSDVTNRYNRYVVGRISLLNNNYTEYQTFDKYNDYTDFIVVVDNLIYYRYVETGSEDYEKNSYVGLLNTFNEKEVQGQKISTDIVVNKFYATIVIYAIVYVVHMDSDHRGINIMNFTNDDVINIDIANGTVFDFQIVDSILIIETNVGQLQYDIDFVNATATEKTTSIIYPSFLEMFKTTNYVIEIVFNADNKFLCNVYTRNNVLIDKIALNAQVVDITYHDDTFNLITGNAVYVWEFEKVLQYATTHDLEVLQDLNVATNSRMDIIETRMDSIDSGGFQQQIDDEVTARVDAISSLTSSNSNEHSNMLNRITAVEDAVQNTDLGTEITDRTDADDLLRNSIANLDAQVLLTKNGTPLKDLSDQVQTNTDDLAALQLESVATEHDERVAADITLQDNIDNEQTAREYDVTSLNDRITDIQTTSISAEEDARIASDNSLSTRIDSEYAQRISDVSGITDRLDTLESSSSSFTFFDNYNSTGIDIVPIGNVIVIKSNINSKMEQLIKIANTGMTETSTIQDFKNDDTLFRILDIELGLIDLGTF